MTGNGGEPRNWGPTWVNSLQKNLNFSIIWMPLELDYSLAKSTGENTSWLTDKFTAAWCDLGAKNHPKSYQIGETCVVLGHLLFSHKVIPTLCDPIDSSMPGSPILHYLLEFAQIHLILCHHLLLLPSIFPAPGSSPMSWPFTLSGENIRA